MTSNSDMFIYENKLFAEGVTLIAGMDEAGRGPLAGPVTAACCIPDFSKIVEGVNDSKKLTEKKRESLFDLIKNSSVSFSVVSVDEATIDEINILNATKKAMKEALQKLEIKPEYLLVDAVKCDFGLPYSPIIHGDALSYSIAAASVLAKVTRDRLMLEYDELYPEYGFAKHKGYGTKQHIEALKKYGPCPIHRRTFIKNFFN